MNRAALPKLPPAQARLRQTPPEHAEIRRRRSQAIWQISGLAGLGLLILLMTNLRHLNLAPNGPARPLLWGHDHIWLPLVGCFWVGLWPLSLIMLLAGLALIGLSVTDRLGGFSILAGWQQNMWCRILDHPQLARLVKYWQRLTAQTRLRPLLLEQVCADRLSDALDGLVQHLPTDSADTSDHADPASPDSISLQAPPRPAALSPAGLDRLIGLWDLHLAIIQPQSAHAKPGLRHSETLRLAEAIWDIDLMANEAKRPCLAPLASRFLRLAPPLLDEHPPPLTRLINRPPGFSRQDLMAELWLLMALHPATHAALVEDFQPEQQAWLNDPPAARIRRRLAEGLTWRRESLDRQRAALERLMQQGLAIGALPGDSRQSARPSLVLPTHIPDIDLGCGSRLNLLLATGLARDSQAPWLLRSMLEAMDGLRLMLNLAEAHTGLTRALTPARRQALQAALACGPAEPWQARLARLENRFAPQSQLDCLSQTDRQSWTLPARQARLAAGLVGDLSNMEAP